MKADEARRQTKNVLYDTAIVPYYNHVITKIEAAISDGKFCVYHPLSGLKKGLSYPSMNIMEALVERLRNDGFDVIRHPGISGSNDPREGPYDEISWK